MSMGARAVDGKLCAYLFLIDCMLETLGFITEMFCATCSMHKAGHRRKVRSFLKTYLQSNITVVFEKPVGYDEIREHNKMLLDLLELSERTNWSEIDIDDDDDVRSKRCSARRKLLDFFPFRWDGSGQLIHRCHPGCSCKSIDESISTGVDLFCLAFLDYLPKVPAMNGWTKLFQSITWWLFGCLFGGLIVKAFSTVIRTIEEDGVVVLAMPPMQPSSSGRRASAFEKPPVGLTKSCAPLSLRSLPLLWLQLCMSWGITLKWRVSTWPTGVGSHFCIDLLCQHRSSYNGTWNICRTTHNMHGRFCGLGPKPR